MVGYKYIIQAIEKSYSHKPHLAMLPYDLNTNDPKKLKERLRACNRELREAQSDLKYAKENVDMMTDNIEEIEENEKLFQEDIQKMEEQNAQIKETMGKVYDHFEDVTMMTEDDGWRIKKEFDKVINSEFWNAEGDTEQYIEEQMKHFIDETTLQGYIGPEDVKEIKVISKDLNDLMGETYSADEKPIFSGREWGRFHEDAQFVQTLLDKYCTDYDISKDTPLTRELNKIEKKGNLSDKWDMIIQRNDNEIKKINNTIEKENERKEGIIERRKDEQKLVGKLETKVNDFKTHKEKIQDKIDKVSD